MKRDLFMFMFMFTRAQTSHNDANFINKKSKTETLIKLIFDFAGYSLHF